MEDMVCAHGRKFNEICPGCPESRPIPAPSRFETAVMRKFETGATRNTDDGKLDFEGFLSPAVLRRFAEYMHKNRLQADGQLRASDNWQKGIPREAYMKSGTRHFIDWWDNHRGISNVDMEEALCALLFNVQGYLFEVLKEKKK